MLAALSQSFCLQVTHAPIGLWGFPGGTSGKEPACQCRQMPETRVQSLGREDPLEEGMATHSSIPGDSHGLKSLAGGLQSKGSQRVGHDWSDFASTHTCTGLDPLTGKRQTKSLAHNVHSIHVHWTEHRCPSPNLAIASKTSKPLASQREV